MVPDGATTIVAFDGRLARVVQSLPRSFSSSAVITCCARYCLRAVSTDSVPMVMAWMAPTKPTSKMVVAIMTSITLKPSLERGPQAGIYSFLHFAGLRVDVGEPHRP